MVMTARPQQKDSPFHDARMLKGIDMIQRAPTGPEEKNLSYLPVEITKKLASFFAEESGRNLIVNMLKCQHVYF